MRRRLAVNQTGFTLIELLIVIAIIGILAAMLIPNLLDAMQKAKQKRTVAEMRITGTAMFSWLSDQVGAAAAGQTATSIDLDNDYKQVITVPELRAYLVPQYIEHIADRDGWRFPYKYYLDTNAVQEVARDGHRQWRPGPERPVGQVHRERFRPYGLRPGHHLGGRVLRPLAAEVAPRRGGGTIGAKRLLVCAAGPPRSSQS